MLRRDATKRNGLEQKHRADKPAQRGHHLCARTVTDMQRAESHFAPHLCVKVHANMTFDDIEDVETKAHKRVVRIERPRLLESTDESVSACRTTCPARAHAHNLCR